nr:cytochrome c biogenesis protein ResB [Nocardioides sp. B-3]
MSRLPEHATYTTEDAPDDVLERAAAELKRRRYRVVVSTGSTDDPWVSAEKGYLREAGNLVFHLSVLVVLVGFAVGGLYGYKGGVIVIEGKGFSNDLTQYDDFVPGSLFKGEDLEPFSFTVKDFRVDWLTEGPRAGMARKFVSTLDYRGDARLRGQGVRPEGQPPADHRQHRGVPDRSRVCARHHRA